MTPKWKIITVVWELTSRCNLSCAHCGSSAGPEGKNERELSFEESKAIVEDIKELGADRVVFSGGEPFLSEYWEPLAEYTMDLGIEVHFVSNGLLVDSELIKRLLKFRNKFAIGLSLDGATPSTHDSIRGCPGLFHRVISAISLFVENKLPVSVITTVHKANMGDLEALWKLLKKTGIYAWQIQPAMPIGRMAERPDLVFDIDDFNSLARFISMVRNDGSIRVEAGDNVGYFGEFESSLRDTAWSGCKAGLNILGIRSNGDIVGCLSLQGTHPEGNVRVKSLKEIWNDKRAFSYNRCFELDELKGECRDCRYARICKGGCSFLSYSYTGEYHNNPVCLRKCSDGNESVVIIG
jgi:radical SAM protein with 4Fe4S-binding SPASM domain